MTRFASPNARNGGVPLKRWQVQQRPIEFLVCGCQIRGVDIQFACGELRKLWNFTPLPKYSQRTEEHWKKQAEELAKIEAHKNGPRIVHPYPLVSAVQR